MLLSSRVFILPVTSDDVCIKPKPLRTKTRAIIGALGLTHMQEKLFGGGGGYFEMRVRIAHVKLKHNTFLTADSEI